MNTTFLLGLSQLAGECIPLKQHFRKKIPGTGLEDQPASFSVLQAPEAGEDVPPHHFAGAFLGAGSQQSRVSTVTPKIFKIHF